MLLNFFLEQAIADFTTSKYPIIGVAIIILLLLAAINEWLWDDGSKERYEAQLQYETRERENAMRHYKKSWPEKYR